MTIRLSNFSGFDSSGKNFFGGSSSHQRESTETESLLRSHVIKLKGDHSGIFLSKVIYYQGHTHWRGSEVLCHDQNFVDKLPIGQVQISSHQESVSSDVTCFSSENCLFWGQQIVSKFSQASVLSLDPSHESKSLFLVILLHKSWLVVPDGDVSFEDQESSSDPFSVRALGCKMQCLVFLSSESTL